jgi:16S rRNA (guanine527-N7)-methyltransferase
MIDRMLSRAAAAGINITRDQAEKFAVYHRMLTEANAKFNLTRVPEDISEAIDRNYLDCILPLKAGLPADVSRIVDVGSGAGFPGIPLSICLPDVHFVLVDALSKRVEFLKSVISALNLNAEAVHARAEDAARNPALREGFDIATARAVASLNLLSEYLLPFVKVGGHMMVLKGPGLDDEIEQAQHALEILGGKYIRTDLAPVPGRDWDHRIAWIEKIESTPEKYPRKAGKPEKSPLTAR